MPIYEYECTGCKRVIEKYLKVIDHERTMHCDTCGSTYRKIISKLGRIDMNLGPLSGVDDTDELTLGKIVANKGMPAEHKREYAEKRRRRAEVAKYDKMLKERSKQYEFDPFGEG